MIKAYSDARNRCYLHPHRQAEHKCERCRTGLCDECDRTYLGRHLCQHCIDELELKEALKPTFGERVRESLTNFRNGSIVAILILAIAGGAFYLFRNQLNTPITPEEMARFRYAASGGFQTPEGVDVNSTVLGAKIASFTGQRVGFEAFHLINEYTGPEYPGWRSADVSFPQDIVVENSQSTQITKFILYQQGVEPRDTWTRRFEVDASTAGPDRGFVPVGSWELTQSVGPQRFMVDATAAGWLRLRILSNYGSGAYTSLDEFDAFVVSQGPGGQVAPAQQ